MKPFSYQALLRNFERLCFFGNNFEHLCIYSSSFIFRNRKFLAIFRTGPVDRQRLYLAKVRNRFSRRDRTFKNYTLLIIWNSDGVCRYTPFCASPHFYAFFLTCKRRPLFGFTKHYFHYTALWDMLQRPKRARIYRMNTLTIRKPDDWHTHLRDGAMLEAVLPFTAQRFGRAVVMPNLSPNPIITTEEMRAYKARIEKTAASFPGFTPLMTYYLTENSSPEDIARGFKEGLATAVKVYPPGTSTNAEKGVMDIAKVYKTFEKMQEIGMPVLLHGERLRRDDGSGIDEVDYEKFFIETKLTPLLKDFPELKVVLEHSTSKDAVDFVLNEASTRLATTVTVHHLMVNAEEHPDREPYFHCFPIIKSEEDRTALRRAATSGSPYFFLGTDSAPHLVSAKESAKPPGGIFTAPAAIELYAQVFEEEGKLENLEAFASINGAKFYGLTPSEETITLEKNPWTIDEVVSVADTPSTPLGTGEKIRPFGYDEDPAKRLQIQWRMT